MESLLASDPPLIREAWIRMRGWYKDAVDHPPPPSRVTIYHMMAEWVELYRHVPFSGQPIPVVVTPLHIDKLVPKDKEITW